MLPYWILFAYFAVGCLGERRRGVEQGISAPLAGGFLLITAMTAFRYRVGGDWGSYEQIYARSAASPLLDALQLGDPGYQMLSWICGQTGAGIWLVNTLCAALFVWGLQRIAKLQPFAWLAVLVAIPYLVIVVAMGYTRQAVAIGFIMAGIASMIRGSPPMRFLVYLTFAALFHKTAVMALPLVLLGTTKNKTSIAVLTLVASIVLYTYLLSGSMDQLTKDYVEAEYNSRGAGVRVAMTVMCGIILIIFGKKMPFTDLEKKIWRNFGYASMAFFIALFVYPSSTVVDRLALYTVPLQIVVLSRIPLLLRNDAGGKILVAIYSFSVLYIWLNFADNSWLWVPYRVFPFGFYDALPWTA